MILLYAERFFRQCGKPPNLAPDSKGFCDTLYVYAIIKEYIQEYMQHIYTAALLLGAGAHKKSACADAQADGGDLAGVSAAQRRQPVQ